MTKNMTTGSPFKLIMSFALPLLLGNLLQQTYNLIDAAIVGRFLGSDALASVGASSSVQFLVLGFCMGTACGYCKAFRSRGHKKAETVFLQFYCYNRRYCVCVDHSLCGAL